MNISGLLSMYDVADVIAHDCVSVNGNPLRNFIRQPWKSIPKPLAFMSYPIMPDTIIIRYSKNGQWKQG